MDWILPDDNEDTDSGDVTCNRCGKTELEWVDCGSAGWKLYEGMKLHVCRNVASKNEFEDVG